MICLTRRLLVVVTGLWVCSPAAASAESHRVICCGGSNVFVVDLKHPAKKKWIWRAADSLEIPRRLRRTFRSTDECKPYGDMILITSSGGGVALIRRRDKKCLFYTTARNAHSGCLLPNNYIAVAASKGGDAVQIFGRDRSGAKVSPTAKLALPGAHGVHWDTRLSRLWALGDHKLVRVQVDFKGTKVALKVDRSFDLPTQGGHDLSPLPDNRTLFVTTNYKVYRFDTQREKFELDPQLGNRREVKSVDIHPETKRIAFQQAVGGRRWWSEDIQLTGPSGNLSRITIGGARLYKVRYDVQVVKKRCR